MKRTLTLASESLAEITSDDLSGVAGAAQQASGLTCPVRDCVLDNPPTFPPGCYSVPWC